MSTEVSGPSAPTSAPLSTSEGLPAWGWCLLAVAALLPLLGALVAAATLAASMRAALQA